jgi:hypothetical protein
MMTLRRCRECVVPEIKTLKSSASLAENQRGHSIDS